MLAEAWDLLISMPSSGFRRSGNSGCMGIPVIRSNEETAGTSRITFWNVRNTTLPSTIARMKGFFYKRKKKGFAHCFWLWCKRKQSRWEGRREEPRIRSSFDVVTTDMWPVRVSTPPTWLLLKSFPSSYPGCLFSRSFWKACVLSSKYFRAEKSRHLSCVLGTAASMKFFKEVIFHGLSDNTRRSWLTFLTRCRWLRDLP